MPYCYVVDFLVDYFLESSHVCRAVDMGADDL